MASYFLQRELTFTAPPTSEEPPKLYSNQTQDDLRLYFHNAILGAKKSVILSIYTLTDPMIISDLRKKAADGVKVTVVTDVKTAEGLSERLGPQVQIDKKFLKGIMHRKILLIDEEQGWLGSANMTRDSLRMHGNLVVGVMDPAMGSFIAKTLLGKGYAAPYQQFNLGGQRVDLSFLPDDRDGMWRIRKLIRDARKSVRVAMFTWTNKELAIEVIEAKDRGRNVEVVIDRQQAKGASGKIVDLLEKRKVPVGLSSGPGLLHYKFLYIDESILVSGSANWTRAAFTTNEEFYLIIYNLNEEQRKQMEKLWSIITQDSTLDRGKAADPGP